LTACARWDLARGEEAGAIEPWPRASKRIGKRDSERETRRAIDTTREPNGTRDQLKVFSAHLRVLP
jgi:hypothetical protein